MYTEEQQTAYMKKWFNLVEKAGKKGFTWASLLENDEWCQYMATGIHKMDSTDYNKILNATIEVKDIFQRVYQYLIENREAFLKLKLPIEFWEVARMEYGNLFSYFTRFDFIMNGNGIKVIEVNSDTPTGYLEPSVANEVLCNYHQVKHPNKLEEKLKIAWDRIIRDYKIQSDEVIHFTSYDWHDEDHNTVEFIRSFCSHSTEYVGIQDIIVSNDGLYTPDGTKINYLYRLYPLEYLLDDVDEYGKKIGIQFLNHIVQNRVKIINPPSAFLIQNKGVLAIIWELHEKQQWFTPEEHAIIEKYFLPTYFSKGIFEESNIDYVNKCIYGREGGGVCIISKGNEIAADKTPYYNKQQKIYQKYVEMPDLTIDTWDGDYTGKLLVGSHLIAGEAAGVFLRVGEKITGNLSMFIGITTENE